MAPVELVAAIGRNEGDRDPAQVVDEEAQQFQRRTIGPVEVLQEQHDGPHAAEPAEEQEQVLEEPRLPGWVGVAARRPFERLPKCGHQAGKVSSSAAEKLVELRRRQLAPGGRAAPR